MKGTTRATAVYFQAIIVGLKGSPPVRAAAAKGDKAVGGETSESTTYVCREIGYYYCAASNESWQNFG
jgi:hypothetical protein